MYCHGRAGQGGAMNYPAPPLAKTELPVDGFKGVLRQSLRDMPAYVEAVLPDKESWTSTHFCKLCPDGASEGHCEPERLIDLLLLLGRADKVIE